MRSRSSFSGALGTYPGLQLQEEPQFMPCDFSSQTGSMSKPSVYAGRKRSRPHLKLKSGPEDGGGEDRNSSKRHRDKLNVELEQLAALLPLPAHLSSRLDKLSIMRLTVSYLRIKTYLEAALPPSAQQETQQHSLVPEGEFMLKALNGFVLIVREDGTILYASQNIQEYLGYQQSDVIDHNVFNLVHTNDRARFIEELLSDRGGRADADATDAGSTCEDAHSDTTPGDCGLLLGPQSRSYICRMRCLLDSSSGFLLMQVQGRLKPVPCAGESEGGSLTLFAVAVPIQHTSIMEIRTRSLIFRTKSRIDFQPVALDNKGKAILGWTDKDFKSKTGYYYIHQDDLVYCAENHLKIIKNGEMGMAVFRLLTKNIRWVWVSSTARVVYKDGQPEFIISTNRVLSDAEGEEHFLKRVSEAKFSLDSQSVLYSIADLLGAKRQAFYQQMEQERAARDPLPPSPTIQELCYGAEDGGYVCHPSASLHPHHLPWPHFPSDISIWELLWRYELCQDDLAVIQQDQCISTLSSAELPDLLTQPLHLASAPPLAPELQYPSSPCPEPNPGMSL